MTDVHDVAVFDNVVFALQVELRGLLQLDFGGVPGAALGASRE